MRKYLLLASCFLLLLTLSACGGGGGGGDGRDPNRQLRPGDFDITANPFDLDPGFPNFTHDGNMLVVNQDGTSKRFWCQTIDVRPRNLYAFSAQGRSLSSNLVEIRWEIDGEPILTQTLPEDGFVTMSTHWNAGNKSQIQLCGINLTTTSGDAFAIDNISLIGPDADCNVTFDGQ